MGCNYQDAFTRHAEDADFLLDDKRWPNADHLYGLAAECALKALLIVYGINNSNGDICDRSYRTHINSLWNMYPAFSQHRNFYAINSQNPFSNWEIGQRYSQKQDIDEQTAKEHKRAVEELRKIINKAKLDGVL